MVERDLGSTYLMPQSKLYKPDNRVIIHEDVNSILIYIGRRVMTTRFVLLQGSDTSNFDSL